MAVFESKYDIDDIFYEIRSNSHDFSLGIRVDSYRITHISFELNEFKYQLISPGSYDSCGFTKTESRIDEKIKDGTYSRDIKEVQDLFKMESKKAVAQISKFKGNYDKQKLKDKLKSDEIESAIKSHSLGLMAAANWNNCVQSQSVPPSAEISSEGDVIIRADSIVLDGNVKNSSGERFVTYNPQTNKFKVGD